MDKARLARALGVVGALLVPAVVVAQQFEANTELRAEDLRTLVTSLTLLQERVLVLETAVKTGPEPERFHIITVDSTTVYRATGDGFIVASPGGTGFQTVEVEARIGTDGDVRHFRATEGNTLNMIVSNENTLVITVSGTAGTASVDLWWYPLHQNSATIPDCQNPVDCDTSPP
jgi:hypothetical protein